MARQRRTAHLSAFTTPDAKGTFDALAEDLGFASTSAALHEMVLEAIRTGRIAGRRQGSPRKSR